MRAPPKRDGGAEHLPIALRACAKLNLTLEVLGRRPDGYHELASVLQAIDLCDVLQVWPDEELELTCSAPDLSGETNLALRAARLLRAEAGVAAGARLHLVKRIPIAAGLGGGSSDAAATLLGLARLWGLGWSPARLGELAARLGSDVPFFLRCATALATGRGEEVAPLPPLAPHWAVVVRPPLREPAPADKTRRLYAALRSEDYRDGRATRALAEALKAGLPPDPALLVNSFERAARDVFPEIREAEERVLAAGARWTHLAGSGPCLYTLFRADEPAEVRRARAVASRVRSTGLETYLAKTLYRCLSPL